MKYLNIIFGLLLIGATITSCKEVGDAGVVLEETQTLLDTTYVVDQIPTAQEKAVFMEEFTGVRCNNCPDGHRRSEELHTQYGDRFVSMVVHTPFLGTPYEGNPNFTIADGEALDALFGPVGIKPSALIDRVQFNTSRVVRRLDWDNVLNPQFAKSTPVNLLLEKVSYDETERRLVYRLTITYTQAANGHSFGLAIAENKLVAAQLDGANVINDYEHNHVLRDYITAQVGEQLTQTLEPGRVIIKEFEYKIPTAWTYENLDLIAYVTAPNEVIHVTKIKLN